MKLSSSTQYIRSMKLNRENINSFDEYPFDLQAVYNLYELSFHPRVTFIVGENGTGKSTILEAVAIAYGFNPEGGTKNFNFNSRDTYSQLNENIRLIKGPYAPKDGFFFRAESFYNVASNIDDLAKTAPGGLAFLNLYGGKSLHAQSHGESFFSLFVSRFSGNSLYILDEPEAALSASRQMAMVRRMHELIQHNCQFIIATHSPIIMAYPDSIIYEINASNITQKDYDETENYQVMRSFFDNPKRIIDMLMKDNE
ncbi:AAA family ATPase [uncultured Clostridium sp.]|uniref:AAA family ATPase n=1 Tax=uncultured Clostridium sp. TaxID=59620 RepID=UPI0028E3EF52|nr:AAA family ATPase [uncultured Clostridium sp.]